MKAVPGDTEAMPVFLLLACLTIVGTAVSSPTHNPLVEQDDLPRALSTRDSNVFKFKTQRCKYACTLQIIPYYFFIIINNKLFYFAVAWSQVANWVHLEEVEEISLIITATLTSILPDWY